MNVAIVGLGRMGRAVAEALADAGHRVVAEIGSGGDADGRVLAEAMQAVRPDVAIEFTTPAAARDNVVTLIRCGTPVVCGTTGWDTSGVAELAAERGTPVLVAANFSIGVAVLRQAVRRAGEMLRRFPEFEPGIVERHHRAKKDAPSGTALLLGRTLGSALGRSDVPAVSLRQGGQPGEHTVFFEGAYECLSFTHQVRSRSVFALGAVRAAEWLARERPRGLVSFDDFLERAE